MNDIMRKLSLLPRSELLIAWQNGSKEFSEAAENLLFGEMKLHPRNRDGEYSSCSDQLCRMCGNYKTHTYLENLNQYDVYGPDFF